MVPQKGSRPNLRVGFGLQGIATGNPGYFATSERAWLSGNDKVAAYLGIGFRANENHGHLVGGAKITPDSREWTYGIQLDGHDKHPFVANQIQRDVAIGVYWIEMKSLGFMISLKR